MAVGGAEGGTIMADRPLSRLNSQYSAGSQSHEVHHSHIHPHKSDFRNLDKHLSHPGDWDEDTEQV